MWFDNIEEQIRLAGLVARTPVVRGIALTVCTRTGSERVWLQGHNLEHPLTEGQWSKLLDIMLDRGSLALMEKKPTLKDSRARQAFLSASGFLCERSDTGKTCPDCREARALQSLLGGNTLEEAGLLAVTKASR